MFRQSSETEYGDRSEGGARFLFGLDGFEVHDTLDAEGVFHHFVLAAGEGEDEDEAAVYETDRETTYELMARYLAGLYEKEEYEMERSPAHDALLDVLELATARARTGDSEFTLDDLEDDEVNEDDFEEEFEDDDELDDVEEDAEGERGDERR